MENLNITIITYEAFKERYDVNFKAKTKEGGLLGVGGFGKVYKGYDKLQNQEVAIKRALTDKDLLLEVEMGKPIPTRKNIARYLDGFRVDTEGDDYDVAIMQYYPAGNLDELFFRHKDRDAIKALHLDSILKGVLEGLAFLHEGFKNDKGKIVYYVHRDLKPANILIAEYNANYTPLLTDFGIAKTLLKGDQGEQHSQGISTTVGTIYYKAPEQFKVGAKYNASLDLWAFGVMLFKILTNGKLPFYYQNQEEADSSRREVENQIMNKDLEEVFAQVADQPEKYQQMLRLCLVRDYKQRVQSARELIDIVDEIESKLKAIEKWLVQGDHKTALAAARELLKLRPQLKEAQKLKEKCELLIEREKEVARNLSEARSFLENDELDSAKKAFEAVLTLDPDNTEAKHGLEKCEALLKKAKEIQASLEVGNKLLKAESFSDAKRQFEKVAALQPANTAALAGIKACEEAEAKAEPEPELPTDEVEAEEPTDDATPPVAVVAPISDRLPVSQNYNKIILIAILLVMATSGGYYIYSENARKAKEDDFKRQEAIRREAEQNFRKADSLFLEGKKQLDYLSKEEVNRRYFRPAFELWPTINFSIRKALLTKADSIRKYEFDNDHRTSDNYVKLADTYR
ncbi:protein kinase domain-containing protein [Runella sp.]|uniref:protein kinase domain-containing protein n=1 Tax=Runella sp. TaxID=1960881 RepID=UPI003D09F2C7